MGVRWERAGELDRLAGEISEVATAYRVSAIEMTNAQRWALLAAAVELAGEMAQDLTYPTADRSCPAGPGCEVGC
jgi:NAD(P)H-nitrite reductase large subunit